MVIKLVIHLFLLVTFADLPKKSRTSEGSSFGSSAIFFSRPAAFRPLFTEGLALSGESLYFSFIFCLTHLNVNMINDSMKLIS